MPGNRRYYESVSQAIARDRNLFRICGLEVELWPDDRRQWSRTTLDLMGVRVEDVWGQPLEVVRG